MNYLYPLLDAIWVKVLYVNGKRQETLIVSSPVCDSGIIENLPLVGVPENLYYQDYDIQLLGQAVEYTSGKFHFFALCVLCCGKVVIPNLNYSLSALDTFCNTFERIGTIIPRRIVENREILARKIYTLSPYTQLLPELKLETSWKATCKPHYKNELTVVFSESPFTQKAKLKALEIFNRLAFDISGLILCEFNSIPKYYFMNDAFEIQHKL